MSKESAPYNVVQPLTDAELLPIQQRQRIAQSLADFSGEAGQTEWYALDVGCLLATIEALKADNERLRSNLSALSSCVAKEIPDLRAAAQRMQSFVEYWGPPAPPQGSDPLRLQD